MNENIRDDPTSRGSAVACVVSSMESRAAYSSWFSSVGEEEFSRTGIPLKISLLILDNLCKMNRREDKSQVRIICDKMSK